MRAAEEAEAQRAAEIAVARAARALQVARLRAGVAETAMSAVEQVAELVATHVLALVEPAAGADATAAAQTSATALRGQSA